MGTIGVGRGFARWLARLPRGQLQLRLRLRLREEEEASAASREAPRRRPYVRGAVDSLLLYALMECGAWLFGQTLVAAPYGWLPVVLPLSYLVAHAAFG